MKCPAGHPGEIPDDALSCPICGVDLSALQRVRQLHIAEYNEAARLAEAGAVELALTHALASLSWDNHYVPAITLVGKLLWQKKRFHEAMERWRQAASISPGDKEVNSLIEHGRVFLKRRRLLHVFYASAAVLVMAVVFLFLPLYTFMSADKKISAMSMTVSNLSGQARTLSENQAMLSARIEDQTDGAHNFEASIDELRHELKAEISKLSEKFLLVSEEQAIILSRIEAQAKGFRDFEVAIDVIRDELSSQASTLNKKADALSDEQAVISAGIKSNVDDIGVLTDTFSNLERKLINQTSTIEASVSKNRQAISRLIEGLRPPQMNGLEEEISQTRKHLAEVKKIEESLRHPSNPLAVFKHRRVKGELQELRDELQDLENIWQKDVAPWFRVKQKTAPLWENGNEER